MMRLPPCSPLFPYPTLFRSVLAEARPARDLAVACRQGPQLQRRIRAVGEHNCSCGPWRQATADRKSTPLNSSHRTIADALLRLEKKKLKSNEEPGISTRRTR